MTYNIEPISIENPTNTEPIIIEVDKTIVSYGKLLHLFGPRNSYFPCTCIVGPEWKMVPFTLLVVLSISFLFIFLIATEIHAYFTIATSTLTVLTLMSFIITACSDAGVIYVNDYEDATQEGIVMCGNFLHPKNKKAFFKSMIAQCQFLRPSLAKHCTYCKVCVNELDHHCPIIGKCIGKKTKPFFIAFIITLKGLILLLVGGTVYKLTTAFLTA